MSEARGVWLMHVKFGVKPITDYSLNIEGLVVPARRHVQNIPGLLDTFEHIALPCVILLQDGVCVSGSV